MGGFNGDPVMEQLILICLFTGIVTAFAEVFGTNLRVKVKVLKLEISNFIIQMSNAVIQAYIALNANLFINPAISIMEVNLILQILRLITFFALNVRESIFTKPKLTLIKQYLIDTKLVILQSILEVVCVYLGSVLIGLNFGIDQLAYYNFAMNYFVNIFITLLISVTPFFDAIFPKMLAEKRYKETNAIVNQFEKYALIFFQLLVISTWLYGETVLELILPNYLPGMKYILWLIFLPLFDAILRPYWGNLYQGRKQDLCAKIGLFTTFSTLILQIVLIPTNFFSIPMVGLGTWGFVINFWFLYIFRNIIFRHYSKKFFEISSNLRYGKNITIGITSFFLVFGINLVLIPILGRSFSFIGISAILLICIYLGFMFLTKELTIADFRYFKSLTKISSYVNSLKDEFKDERPPCPKE